MGVLTYMYTRSSGPFLLALQKALGIQPLCVEPQNAMVICTKLVLKMVHMTEQLSIEVNAKNVMHTCMELLFYLFWIWTLSKIECNVQR